MYRWLGLCGEKKCKTVTTAESGQCVIIMDCVVGDEKTVTTDESGQCVIIMDCVVGDEKTVTTAESGQCVIIMDCVVRRHVRQ